MASSVRGPGHLREGLPCQDAWLAVPGPGPCFAAVSDGMGSRPRARDGAQAAVRAARDAWRTWRRSAAGSAEDLVRLLEVIWRLHLDGLQPDLAASTCLLYAEDGHGRAALAQLGDGLLARRRVDGSMIIHPSRSQGLGTTFALGVPHALADWSLALAPALVPGETLVLATDGVAEDLELPRLGDLVAWAVAELGPDPSPGRRLRTELQHWPVPRHQDDKTLLIMWNPCNPT